jgi:hypothetical protein
MEALFLVRAAQLLPSPIPHTDSLGLWLHW